MFNVTISACLDFVFHFMLDPDSNPVPEPNPECIPAPVQLGQKVVVLTGSGSGFTTLPRIIEFRSEST
jgi:hypothetical protein